MSVKDKHELWFVDFWRSHLRLDCAENGPPWSQLQPKWASVILVALKMCLSDKKIHKNDLRCYPIVPSMILNKMIKQTRLFATSGSFASCLGSASGGSKHSASLALLAPRPEAAKGRRPVRRFLFKWIINN